MLSQIINYGTVAIIIAAFWFLVVKAVMNFLLS